MKKIILGILIIISLLIAISLVGNTYDMTVEKMTIETENGTLIGVIARPKDYDDKLGVILVVHGDGPATATAEGGYKPVWEVMANEGYAIVSWNKPGVEGSEGNWLDQNMNDRADEVVAVIDWVKSQDEFNHDNIGIWGASQAGWVVPKVVRKRDVQFTIMVSPAINWIRQGQYYTVSQLRNEGKSEEEINEAILAFEQEIKALDSDITYEAYVDSVKDGDFMTKDRFEFVMKNYKGDVTDELKNFDSPVLLILGGQDINVDPNETREFYENEISDDILTVKWIEETNHQMFKPSMIDNNIWLSFNYMIVPRQIFEKDYFEAIKDFLE